MRIRTSISGLLFGCLFGFPTPTRAGDDISRRFAQSWEAIEAGRTAEAEAGLRALVGSDPGYRPAARLVRVLDRLEKAPAESDREAVRSRLPGIWKEARSPHFLLLHQHSEAEAAGRLRLAERVLTTYYLWLTGLGLDLEVPDRPLVSIWFARRSDYAASLEAIGAGSFAGTLGHYSPIDDVVSAADERSEPLDDDSPAADAARKAREIATLAHETVHNLAVRSGLERPGVDWPRWLQEGLAMLFESSRGGEWAGVGGPNEHRLPLYRAIRPAPRLAATVRDVGFDARYDPDRYGASWSLVEFLSGRHPREFVAILDRFRTPDASTASAPERASEAFRAAFGEDWPVVEREWHQEMASAHRTDRSDSGWIRPRRKADE